MFDKGKTSIVIWGIIGVSAIGFLVFGENNTGKQTSQNEKEDSTTTVDSSITSSEHLQDSKRDRRSTTTMNVTSSAFENKEFISEKYTCDGEGVSPPLSVSEVPEGTRSLVLIMEDPDAPNGTFDHWIVWNIPSSIDNIEENTTPGVEGKNSTGESGYFPPCPPPADADDDSGEHRYIFNVYALGTVLSLDPDNATKEDVQEVMEGNVLDSVQITGLYRRTS